MYGKLKHVLFICNYNVDATDKLTHGDRLLIKLRMLQMFQ